MGTSTSASFIFKRGTLVVVAILVTILCDITHHDFLTPVSALVTLVAVINFFFKMFGWIGAQEAEIAKWFPDIYTERRKP